MDGLWVELIFVYVAMPVAFAYLVYRVGYRGSMFPLLWVVTGLCMFVLLRDGSFDRAILYRIPFEHPHMRVVAVRFVALSVLLAIVTRITAPEWFLWLPRKQPRLWVMFLFGYPAISAIPQGVVWRVFFEHRYNGMLGDEALLVVGGLTFAIAHLAYRNAIAIALTAVGGVMFLDTYIKTQSMLLATLEHGAYGIAAFTFGLGRYLYLAARP
jgi:hypothetical protein